MREERPVGYAIDQLICGSLDNMVLLAFFDLDEDLVILPKVCELLI